ncbi:hypothetical protein DFH29DRAFT_887821 [Suillus ampliporus]|nr:hypothetical protein DFH29DRAFT_887821 [Suillus ampliporus]
MSFLPSTPSFSASPATYISCSPSPSPSLSHTYTTSQLESSLAPTMTSASPPLTELANVQLPLRSDSDTFAESESASVSLLADVDPQIIEALKSKDRIYVLKLGEQMESLINDRNFRARLDLTPTTSYQRLLVHRCSAYYKLAPETDPISKAIGVTLSLDSRIPARRIAALVPAQLSAHPTIKIMRRSATDRGRSKPHSQAGSIAGEDPDLSDVEPSESGSQGGRSNATGSSKKHKTIAEREAAYNEARSRIFMDFEEREKGKEKDLSASCSTISLTSGSVTSAGETSSAGDLDIESVSSPTTESEWSGPAVRDKRDSKRSNGSTRSLRSSAPVFNVCGSSSSRGSRAPSPSSFKYPTLYEPSPAAPPYDGAHPPAQPGFVNPYVYAYPQPPPPSNYIPGYPYYAPYPYPHPQAQMHAPDNSSAHGAMEAYPSPQHAAHPGVYVPYAWSPAQQQQPLPHPSMQHTTQQHPNPSVAPPASQYSTFTPPVPPYGPYPMPGYFTQPPPIPHVQSSPPTVQNHGHYPGNGYMNGAGGNDAMSLNRSYPGDLTQSSSMGPKPRGAPPARTAWSYGPGVGMGGFGVNNMGSRPSGGEVVGPRLSSSVRRPSGNSNASAGGRTPAGDEASSTASSSTTSSSSRRTFTSTSSQHPLPARPDWAVGLKPQPTLHATHPRHHDHSMNSRTMSPARNNSQRGHQNPPASLHPTDFPPLSTMSPAVEKRTPAIAGVWTNSSSTRSILMPGNNTSHGNAPNHSNTQSNMTGAPCNTRLEDTDSGFERPPPKGNVELFNPKGIWKPGGPQSRSPPGGSQDKDKIEKLRGEAVANAILVDKMAMVSVEDNDASSNMPNVSPHVALAT